MHKVDTWKSTSSVSWSMIKTLFNFAKDKLVTIRVFCWPCLEYLSSKNKKRPQEVNGK